ncbi:FxSxx-COOH system tetratricopeptide repeat protein [Thermostaphylospora chromogena]|uniref:NB-ARC domain-containing protein n=1 Tax=Thermostaphylospora chromogena TaxID=35622 RepID=A0A1H1HES3_9ACTN|nr:FxSxx-COOH system tetratricopeptide repeat protein [Thermostaphylospora chromogena]SDR23658.1 NB-ARC domain-containing protein [Thermostaphylospora chromogena]
MPDSTPDLGIYAEGDRSISAFVINAATTGDHSPIIKLEPGTLRPAAAVEPGGRVTNLPRAHSKVFVGRTDAMAAVEEAFTGASGQVVIGQVIQGMGGVGKSELARQYIDRHKDRYRVVWWITATNPEQITTDLAHLAERLHPPLPQAVALSMALGLDKAADWAKAWLQSHDGWLLVLDNLEDPRHIQDLLGQLRSGHIVITTRRQVAWPAGVTHLSLDILTPQAAIELLLAVSERTPDPDEEPVFAAIAKELGYLPLALEQAASYIREARISPARYRQQLAKHPLHFYQASLEEADPQQTIARLWDAHLALIRTRNPQAELVLRVLACFAPDRIPRDIIGGAQAAEDPAMLDVLRLLASYSLITLEEQTLNMHRLLQAVITAADDTRTQTATDEPSSPQLALSWLADAWSAAADLPPSERTGRWQMLTPHLESLIRHHPITDTPGKDDWIFPVATNFERSQGNYHRAKLLARHTLALMTTSRGREHFYTLIARGNLASVLGNLGRLEEAEAEFRAVLEVSRRVLGEEHPITLTDRGDLAGVLGGLGRLEEAVAEIRAVLPTMRRVLGEEHPITLTNWGNLAFILGSLGRLEEAEAEFRAVLEVSHRVLGEEQPITLANRGNLALVLGSLGRLEEAEAEHRVVLEASRRVLGEEHPITLTSWNNLAGALGELGRLEEAEAEFRAVLEARRRVLGEEHPDTLTSRSDLAEALAELGRLEEAEAEFQAVLDVLGRHE